MSPGSRVDERTDAELVEGVLLGRNDLFGALCERYQARLYRYALGMTSRPEVAADLVQESLVRAYSRLASCRFPDRFGSWLFRILRNECLDHLKSRRREDRSLDEVTLYASDHTDPELRLERSELGRAVAAALRRLPDAQREAFLMKHVEGFEYEEMSEILGSSVSALKMRVKRAREALQESLRRSGQINEHVTLDLRRSSSYGDRE